MISSAWADLALLPGYCNPVAETRRAGTLARTHEGHAGRIDKLPELEDTLVALHLAVLAGRPWPPGT